MMIILLKIWASIMLPCGNIWALVHFFEGRKRDSANFQAIMLVITLTLTVIEIYITWDIEFVLSKL